MHGNSIVASQQADHGIHKVKMNFADALLRRLESLTRELAMIA
jgi:hypothetical protein